MRYKPGVNTQTGYYMHSSICHRLHGSVQGYVGFIIALADRLHYSILSFYSPKYSLRLRVCMCLLVFIHTEGVYKEFLSSFGTIYFRVDNYEE